ncbi:hypothetical protein GOHSU_29_00470 [Gordonia hirsuta DSM 44140 = NBRC 16056]|uniref:Uncharacterized protein n=1 Tax=Gordonia hirsuta DSM 44140 = NBRC 16056 TaxID=1121927 RepID=L7LAY6_9ACTN|nr:hypothetical protein GOHSU_29_00470 [Gordonia hirsuta DSM 44140 = NBRC 16056]
MQAYETVAVPGFPNRWIIVGPYAWTGIGCHSLAENAVLHAVRAMTLARGTGTVRMEVRHDALRRFMDLMWRNGRNLRYYFTQLNKGVHSYWVNGAGEIPILRPTTLSAARRASEDFPISLPQRSSPFSRRTSIRFTLRSSTSPVAGFAARRARRSMSPVRGTAPAGRCRSRANTLCSSGYS